jgi:hypothetical protein
VRGDERAAALGSRAMFGYHSPRRIGDLDGDGTAECVGAVESMENACQLGVR